MTWNPPAGGGGSAGVSSFKGRTGAVNPALNDYTDAQVQDSPTQVLTSTGDVLYASAANTLDRLAVGSDGDVLTIAAGVPSWAPGGSVDSVFGRTGTVVAQTGDYTAAEVGALAETDTLADIATANPNNNDVDVNNRKVVNVSDPTSPQDAATKAYVDSLEIGYDEITAPVTVTSTTEAAGDTVIAAAAHTFDGNPVIVEFFSPETLVQIVAGGQIFIDLFEGSTQIGRLASVNCVPANSNIVPVVGKLRFTPTAGAHTYTVSAWLSANTGTNSVLGGPGGTAQLVPAYLRFSKA